MDKSGVGSAGRSGAVGLGIDPDAARAFADQLRIAAGQADEIRMDIVAALRACGLESDAPFALREIDSKLVKVGTAVMQRVELVERSLLKPIADPRIELATPLFFAGSGSSVPASGDEFWAVEVDADGDGFGEDGRPLPSPGNWAGFDDAAIAAGDEAAARLFATKGGLYSPSDAELMALAVWVWRKQHQLDAKGQGQTNDARDVFMKLAPDAQSRLWSLLCTFDTRAYLAVRTLRSPRTDELFTWFASPAFHDMTDAQRAAYAKAHFQITDPAELDATLTYIGYQLRGAHVAWKTMRSDDVMFHGWMSPVIDVQPWAMVMLHASRAKAGSIVHAMHATLAIGEYLQGRTPLVNGDLVAIPENFFDKEWRIDGKDVAIVILGIVVAALFIGATGGVAAAGILLIEQAIVAYVGPALASVLATVIVTALVGVGAEVTAGVATRFARWLVDGGDFADVFDGDLVARDALIGGITGGVFAALQRGVAIAFSDMNKASRAIQSAEKDLARINRGDAANRRLFEQKLANARERFAKAQEQYQTLLAARARMAAEACNEIGALDLSSFWRVATGRSTELSLTRQVTIDQAIRTYLRRQKLDPHLFDTVVGNSKMFSPQLLDDARIAIVDLIDHTKRLNPGAVEEAIRRISTADTESQLRAFIFEVESLLYTAKEATIVPGSKIAIGVTRKTNGPSAVADLGTTKVDLRNINDADLVSLHAGGVVRVTEAKTTVAAIQDKMKNGMHQFTNLAEWKNHQPSARRIQVDVSTETDWSKLFLEVDPKGIGGAKNENTVIAELAAKGFDLRLGGRNYDNALLTKLAKAYDVAFLNDESISWKVKQALNLEGAAALLGVAI